MANPLRGEAPLKAGDATYTIVLDVNAFCDIEAESGLNPDQLVEKLEAGAGFVLLRSIFAAGLQAKHPGTTLREAGEIMSAAGLEEMGRALTAVVQQAMPPAKAGGRKGQNPPQRKTARR